LKERDRQGVFDLSENDVPDCARRSRARPGTRDLLRRAQAECAPRPWPASWRASRGGRRRPVLRAPASAGGELASTTSSRGHRTASQRARMPPGAARPQVLVATAGAVGDYAERELASTSDETRSGGIRGARSAVGDSSALCCCRPSRIRSRASRPCRTSRSARHARTARPTRHAARPPTEELAQLGEDSSLCCCMHCASAPGFIPGQSFCASASQA